MNWSRRDQLRAIISRILRSWTRRLPLLWTRSSRIPTSRKRSVWRNRKRKKRIGFYEEDRSPSSSTTTFELLVLMIQFLITLIYSQSLFVTKMFRNSIQDGMRFYYQRRRSHRIMFWKVCTNWEDVSLHNSRLYWNCIARHWDSSEDIDAQLSKVENNGEEEKRSETSITKLWRQAWENWIRSRGKESDGTKWALKEEKVSVTSGKKKTSVRRETDAVSATRPKIVRKIQNTLPPHLLSQPYHEVEVCRAREVSEAKVTMVPFFDNRADVIWKVLARHRFVNIDILPSVKSTKQKRVAKPGIRRVCSRTTRLMNNQPKSQRKATIPTK